MQAVDGFWGMAIDAFKQTTHEVFGYVSAVGVYIYIKNATQADSLTVCIL